MFKRITKIASVLIICVFGILVEPLNASTYTTKVNATGTISAEELDTKLTGKLKGKGQAFIDAEQKYGVNAAFLVAIAWQESGRKSNSQACMIQNNPFGIRSFNKKSRKTYRSFSTIDEAIDFHASMIQRLYINKGRKDVDNIAKKYTANPKHWAKAVKSLMKSVYS